MSHNKFYELLKLSESKVFNIKNVKSKSSEASYFFVPLPCVMKDNQYKIISSHITIFETLDDIGSRLHLTLSLEDNKKKTYTLRVYFTNKNRIIFSPSFKNASNERQTLSKEDADAWRAFALNEVKPFFDEMNQLEDNLYIKFLNGTETLIKSLKVNKCTDVDDDFIARMTHFTHYVLTKSSSIMLFTSKIEDIKSLSVSKIEVKPLEQIKGKTEVAAIGNSKISTPRNIKKNTQTKISDIKGFLAQQKTWMTISKNLRDEKNFEQFIDLAKTLSAKSNAYQLLDQILPEGFEELLSAINSEGEKFINQWFKDNDAPEFDERLNHFSFLICNEQNLSAAMEELYPRQIAFLSLYGNNLNFKKYISKLASHIQQTEIIEDPTEEMYINKVIIADCLKSLFYFQRLSLIDSDSSEKLPLFFTLICRPFYCRIAIEQVSSLPNEKKKKELLDTLSAMLERYFKNKKDPDNLGILNKYRDSINIFKNSIKEDHIVEKTKKDDVIEAQILALFFESLAAWCVENPAFYQLFLRFNIYLSKAESFQLSSKKSMPKEMVEVAKDFLMNISIIKVFEVFDQMNLIREQFSQFEKQYIAYVDSPHQSLSISNLSYFSVDIPNNNNSKETQSLKYPLKDDLVNYEQKLIATG